MSAKEKRGELVVDPPALVHFVGPFTKPVINVMTLTNPTDHKMIFKIKTTAPTCYGVRPNFGIVQPRNFVEIEISLQPFNYDENKMVTHKFMVQSLTVPNTTVDIKNVFQRANPADLQIIKLRCAFEIPKSTTSKKETTNERVHEKATKAFAN